MSSNPNFVNCEVNKPLPIINSNLIRNPLCYLFIRACKVMVKYDYRSYRFFWLNWCVHLVDLKWLSTFVWIHVQRQICYLLSGPLFVWYKWFWGFYDWSLVNLLVSLMMSSLDKICDLWSLFTANIGRTRSPLLFDLCLLSTLHGWRSVVNLV